MAIPTYIEYSKRNRHEEFPYPMYFLSGHNWYLPLNLHLDVPAPRCKRLDSFFFQLKILMIFCNVLESLRQERPPHLRPHMIHPALREKGRAIPHSHIVPRVTEPETPAVVSKNLSTPRLVSLSLCCWEL